jgi:ADP-ribosylglycohydrolase
VVAIVKLWLGFPPTRSGVWSGGNGPAMRSALLGVCLGADPAQLRAFVRASTRLTHTDPRAERGALLVALAAYHGATHPPAEITGESFLAVVRREVSDLDPELEGILAKMAEHLARGAPVAELADALGLQRGVTGYVYHTVPIALYCWLRAPGDFRGVIEEVIPLGGDADTTGAIAGALVGATVGVENIPSDWIAGIWDWPYSVRWMRTLAARLAHQFGSGEQGEAGPLRIFWPGLLARNLFFFAVVLVHIFRRWLPPY